MEIMTVGRDGMRLCLGYLDPHFWVVTLRVRRNGNMDYRQSTNAAMEFLNTPRWYLVLILGSKVKLQSGWRLGMVPDPYFLRPPPLTTSPINKSSIHNDQCL